MGTQHRLFFTCFSLLLATFAMASAREAFTGGYQQVQANEIHIQDLGKYAVLAYNKQSGAKLSFISVVEAKTQVVSGANYKLAIQALEDPFLRVYKAIVWEKSWLKYRNLTSFEAVLA
ncbi:cysteine proteinase inhibitor 5 [Amborella trichopoda]|uniref:Cystatin domain-containing protein n=1 Tax=Amborella trichopoda TaxID=13333 RepID=U5D745_AMBTC|nr:cysteine proteinase inhibitor 5 [Amborella trichopoda]ERN18289.1 hypothetical protein AMTR_s00055p00160920 [Amborella trichopoda]|eukprot:XP_006856822.1 cysteine proteinase inhibitor 5 [Amborella trichopoda]